MAPSSSAIISSHAAARCGGECGTSPRVCLGEVWGALFFLRNFCDEPNVTIFCYVDLVHACHGHLARHPPCTSASSPNPDERDGTPALPARTQFTYHPVVELCSGTGLAGLPPPSVSPLPFFSPRFSFARGLLVAKFLSNYTTPHGTSHAHTHTNTRKDHTDHQKVHQPPRITTAADHPGNQRLPQRGARGRRSVVSPLASRPPRPLDAGFTAPGSPPPPANARSRSARRTAPAAGGGAVPRHDLRRGRLLRYSSAATMRSLRGWGEVASLG